MDWAASSWCRSGMNFVSCVIFWGKMVHFGLLVALVQSSVSYKVCALFGFAKMCDCKRRVCECASCMRACTVSFLSLRLCACLPVRLRVLYLHFDT